MKHGIISKALALRLGYGMPELAWKQVTYNVTDRHGDLPVTDGVYLEGRLLTVAVEIGENGIIPMEEDSE